MSTEALSETGNDRIVMGGNMSPFDAHKVNIDDLFAEAEVWLTGEGVQSEAEAKAVETLLDMAREAKKAADEARKTENEPFDKGKAEVQARYNPILKRAELIAEACKKVLQPWRDKIAREAAAKAEAMRQEAEALKRQADEEIRASAGNLTARAKAEETLAFAKDAEKAVGKATKAATTNTGLRTTYRAELADLNAAIKHYWSTNRAEFETLVCDLAARQVRAGIREIPGFNVIEERKAV